METFDFIIVGAGSAGCVLADRLSADGRSSVLLLEAGGDDRRLWISMPIGYGKTFYDEKVNWKYSTEPEAGLGKRQGYWPRGRVLGGSSAINAMVYCRGLPTDYDDWRDAGNPGWGWEDVAPTFRSFEQHVRPDGSVQGPGPLSISAREPEYHPVKRHFLAAAQELGLSLSDDLNGPSPEGVGAYAITTRRGLRCSAADAFLRPALPRANLHLRTRALAQRLMFEGSRAVGLQYLMGGQQHEVRARCEVLLCAGAVNSPQLLQLSGIGPGPLLQSLGIPVLRHQPAVGGGLQDHLGINYLYRATEPTLNGVLGSWPGRLAAGLRYVLSRSGPLSLSVNQMGGMVRSSPSVARPDVQLYFSPLSYSTDYVGKRPLLRPDPYPGFIVGFNPCRPHSRGRIDIRSNDPTQAPAIRPQYLSDPRDAAQVLAGARLIGRLQQTRALRALIAGAPVTDLPALSDEAVLQDFMARSGTVYHPCGTCAMGPEHQGGVVDTQLRVFGVQGLRVVDASVFPQITSANTNAPALMVAAHAARFIQQT